MNWNAFALAVSIPAIVIQAEIVLQAEAPPVPQPEPIAVTELPLPPVAPSNHSGACTKSINPHGTGCIGITSDTFQAGDFTPDGNHVLANVEFVGAPTAPDPASVYTGQQLIAVKVDGSLFPNGDHGSASAVASLQGKHKALIPQGITLMLLEMAAKLYGATTYSTVVMLSS